MKLGDVVARIDRFQRAFWFKVIASAVIAVVGLAIVASYAIVLERDRQANEIRVVDAPPEEQEPLPADPAEAIKVKQLREAEKSAAERTAKALNQIFESRYDPTSVAVGAAAVVGLLVAMIWMNIGVYGLGLLAVLLVVSTPMYAPSFVLPQLTPDAPPEAVAEFNAQYSGLRRTVSALARPIADTAPWVRTSSRFVSGIAALTLAFMVLMQLLKAAFAAPHPVLAVARNVVNEAVRIKVSLVFIIILLVAMAALPGLLDPTTPLRYRVQSFLQYGTAGTFWIIAILSLFLAVSSVAFEQRDRIIWQTMTKPVASWQYLLGKWLGVVGVAAVLLAVSSSGVFLFTEFLRSQRAVGEVVPYRSANDPEGINPSEDRMYLETQILASRVAIRPEPPEFDRDAMAEETLAKARLAVQSNPELYASVDEAQLKLLREAEEAARLQHNTIEPGQREKYTFTGLKSVSESGKPISLRYKVDVGGNDPKGLLSLTFVMDNSLPQVKSIPLGQAMVMDISPASIRSDGTLVIEVINGDMMRYLKRDPGWTSGETMSFPPDGLELFYPASSYHANYLRVVIVLWLKLAFLAMVAVWAATFLAFPVASLTAFGTFLIAESAGYLLESLEYYASTNASGQVNLFRVLVRAIAVPIGYSFKFYASLRPTTNLVDGRMIGWDRVALAVVILGVIIAALYAAAVLIFRRRELATYSGN